MPDLLPDRLKALWHEVEEHRLTEEQYVAERERSLHELKTIWKDALLLGDHTELTPSLLSETGEYLRIEDMTEIARRCRGGMLAVKGEWQEKFRPSDLRSAERFYDESQAYIYDLIWWHTLTDDVSPLAYVLALQLAQQQGCRDYLDFGAGVGSGGILFARHGFNITLGDISSTLLQFSEWRLARRRIPVRMLDLKTAKLPINAFDIITAMDVFEHLVDPVGTVENLYASLKPGGLLFGRFDADQDADYPQHIVRDFGPTFQRMREMGLAEIWRDHWLWGHQVFQKRA